MYFCTSQVNKKVMKKKSFTKSRVRESNHRGDPRSLHIIFMMQNCLAVLSLFFITI